MNVFCKLKVIIRFGVFSSFNVICTMNSGGNTWQSGAVAHTRTHTHAWLFYGSMDFVGTTWVSQYQKKHSPAHTCRGHQSSLICFFHLIQSMASSLFNPHAWQSFSTISKFSLVYLLAWHPPLHTPSISSPNHCLLFATHAHTIAACFAVVPRLSSNPSLSSTLYLEFYLVASHHASI